MQFNFNVTDFGNLQSVTMQGKAGLGIRERVVSVELGKSRIAYIFTLFNPAEEILERPINAA
jgi:hypothetical protein